MREPAKPLSPEQISAVQPLVTMLLSQLYERDIVLDTSWGSLGLSWRDRFQLALHRAAEAGLDLGGAELPVDLRDVPDEAWVPDFKPSDLAGS